MLKLKTRSRWRHDWAKFDLHDRSVCFDRHAAGQTSIISEAFTSLTSVNALGGRAFIFWCITPGVNTHAHNIGSPTKKLSIVVSVNPLGLLRRNFFARVHPCVLPLRREKISTVFVE